MIMVSMLATAIHHTIEYGDFNIYIFKGDDQQEHIVLTKRKYRQR